MPMTLKRSLNLALAGLLATFALASLAVPADAEMKSTRLSKHLCKTVGGGRFVKIPGFPGEKIDRRLLRDIKWMRNHFDIFITDGYATSGHAWNGEHPIGLALDIVPYWSRGGTWGKIGDLAHKAEPRQNRPKPPWRWVGWNGDAGHGRGHHLHLSYLHSDTRPTEPARVVYTRRCPERPGKRDRNRDGGDGGTGGVSPKSGASLWPLVGDVAPAVPERH